MPEAAIPQEVHMSMIRRLYDCVVQRIWKAQATSDWRREEMVPIRPGLRNKARYVYAELRRRQVLPPEYSFMTFLEDAVFERVEVLNTVYLEDVDRACVRLMLRPRRYEDTAEVRERLVFFGPET
jgi:hypothetical protein